MRIAIDGRSLQDKPWTGVGQYTYNLLRALFELDRDSEYAVWRNGRGKLEAPFFSEYSNVKVHYTRWPNKILNLSTKMLNAPKLVIGQWKADILFMPNLNFIALPRTPKLVIAAHDLSFEHFPEFFSRKSRLWHKAINPRALFLRADRVIAVSEHTKTDLVDTYGITEKKVSVVYPGVIKTQNAECGIQNGGSYILYFGALEPRKNIEGLIGAYEALKDPPELIIAGRSGTYAAKLKKEIKKSRRGNRIKIIENPGEQEKKELYAGAKLFVYPSFYEGFGFPPLEAMSAGVPVVASSASSAPEICGSAAILVNPFNINEISAGMKILLEDQGLREKYIQAGRERAQQFSWQKCARQTLEIFQKIDGIRLA